MFGSNTNAITIENLYEKDVLVDPTVPEDERPEGGGDGIPDKYQAEVTFKVANGYWNDGESDNADKKVVVTLKENGEPSENGTATLSAPAVGSKPDTTHKASGSWDTTPATYQKGGKAEYTYTYDEKDTYTVTFNSNGGKEPNADVTVTEDETVGSKMPADPTKDQAIFVGWNTEQDGTGTAFTKDTDVTGDITVYAQWEDDKLVDPTEGEKPNGGDGIPDKYQAEVTFKVANGYWNEGTNDNAPKTVVVTLVDGEGNPAENGSATLSAPGVGSNPADGYKAGSWDETPAAYQKGGKAEYTYTYVVKDTYTVTFNSNGGNEPNADVTVTEGETVGSNMPTDPTKDKAIFVGWNTKQDGTGTAFTEDTDVTGDITVYAQWEDDKLVDPTEGEKPNGGDGIPDKYQAEVTFKVANGYWNEGTNDNAPKTVVVTLVDGEGNPAENGSATLSAPAVGNQPAQGFKTGYAAENWNPKIPTMFTKGSAVEYTYTYEQIVMITLTYDAKGGVNPPASQTVAQNTVVTIADAGTMMRDGYTFLGWSENEQATEPDLDLSAGSTMRLTQNTTLYAVWRSLKQLVNIHKDRIEANSTIADESMMSLPGVNYEHTPVIVGDGTVTLLYAITVTGDEGAEYRVTDPDTTPVDGNSLTGTIGSSGNEVIYVTKIIDKHDVVNGVVTNVAYMGNGNPSTTADPNNGTSNTVTTNVTVKEIVNRPVLLGVAFQAMGEGTLKVAQNDIPQNFALHYSYTDAYGKTYSGTLDLNQATITLDASNEPLLQWHLRDDGYNGGSTFNVAVPKGGCQRHLKMSIFAGMECRF